MGTRVERVRASRVDAQAQVNAFNERTPVGTAVTYTKDGGIDQVRTRTRSSAWLLGGHTAVVQIEGMPGCVALERITPIAEPASHE